MQARLNSGREPEAKCSWTRQLARPVDNSLRTLVLYALLLTVCCLYLFKWRSIRRRKVELVSEKPGQHSKPQDRALLSSFEKPNVTDLLRQFNGPRGQISSMITLANGKLIVCACKAENTLHLWNIEGHEEREMLVRPSAAVNVIAPSKDGQLIITGDVNGKVVVWDMSLDKRCEAAKRHGREITALDVSSYIASGSDDGTIMLWRTEEPGSPLVPGLVMRHASVLVSSVKFSPSGRRLASACDHWGHSVKIWHTQTGTQIACIKFDCWPTSSLAWSNDGLRLFAGCDDGSIYCFDTIARKLFPKVVEPRPGDGSITFLHISGSGQFLISFSSPGRMVDIWDIHDIYASRHLYSHSPCVSVSISPDDIYLVSRGNDRNISIRNLSETIEASYFFHRLAPFLSHSEPFTFVSPAAYRAWKSRELDKAERIISKEIEDKQYISFDHYARANRALVRVRQGNLDGALDDTRVTNGIQVPPITHIAKVMALIWQGKRREAINVVASVRHDGTKSFVESVESVATFEVELRDKVDCKTKFAEASAIAITSTSLWVQARKLFLLAEQHVRRGDYFEGLNLLAKVPDLDLSLHIPEALIIPLVFGWDLYDLKYMVRRLRCQALFASGRTQEVTNFLRVNKIHLDETDEARKADFDWLHENSGVCHNQYSDENHLDEEDEVRKAELGYLSENLGDESLCRSRYDDAITWYSVSLGLCPESRAIVRESPKGITSDAADGAILQCLVSMVRYSSGSACLLVKRSMAKGYKGSWDDALRDADQAIYINKVCPWGYERRYMALHALQRYEEATKTLDEIFKKMGDFNDPSIRQLREGYAEATKVINEQIKIVCKASPLVLIDVRTGNLCDAVKRIQMFKKDITFHELVSSMSVGVDTDRIEKTVKETVARYFRYVMFSHTWEGEEEPTFQDVYGRSIYELDPHPLKLKLRRFCKTVQVDPEKYLWAWSDTCCIDKKSVEVARKSIRSMYDWYEKSALTIVLLAGGCATLKDNRWMKRAWTLQELLSPKCIRFYNNNWELYLADLQPNHKESPQIMQELAEAMDIAPGTLVKFSPESLSIRAKLRLASTREATEEVDIAYALIGIFSSSLFPEHRNLEVALGHLLEEIVHKKCEAKAVLDWVGVESSQFNSCLPAQISAYKTPPYIPPPIPEDEMKRRIAELRVLLPREAVTTFFRDLSTLRPINFIHKRLSLPCITFSVSVDTTRHDEAPSDSRRSSVYQAQAAALCQFKFKIPSATPMLRNEVLLVYPWIRDLLTQIDTPEWDDYTRALRLVVYLEQPFRALLLVKDSVDTYKRVATDSEVLVPPRKVVSLKDFGVRVLEIQ